MRDELGPAARALLDAAREGMSPSAAAIHRVRGKVGAAAGVTSGVAAMSLAAKLGILSAVAAIAVGAVIVAQRGDDAPAPVTTAPAQQVAPPPPTPAKIVTPPRHATPAAPTASDDIDADKIEIESPGFAGARSVAEGRRGESIDARPPKPSPSPRPTPVSTPAAPGNGPRVGEVQPSPSPSRKHADLAREVALIDDAMAAFKRGDYTAALTAVHQHATETGGDGQLAEDAAAIEIEALCRSHHSVYTKLQAFDARWPSSAQRSRLTNNCP